MQPHAETMENIYHISHVISLINIIILPRISAITCNYRIGILQKKTKENKTQKNSHVVSVSRLILKCLCLVEIDESQSRFEHKTMSQSRVLMSRFGKTTQFELRQNL